MDDHSVAPTPASDRERILQRLRLSHYGDSFSVHSIHSPSDMRMLTEDQMKELGIWKIGERNRLMTWISRSGSPGDALPEMESSSRQVPKTSLSAAGFNAPVQEVRVQKTSGENRITVRGAGLTEINGVYEENGTWDGVRKYSKQSRWNGRKVVLQLFRCQLLNDAKRRWYISLVPSKYPPGTSLDTDFYASPTVQELADLPPHAGWVTCNTGVNPPPTLEYDFPHSVAGGASTASTNFLEEDDASVATDTAVVDNQRKNVTVQPQDNNNNNNNNSSSRRNAHTDKTTDSSVKTSSVGASSSVDQQSVEPGLGSLNIRVQNAGSAIVNGIYEIMGTHDRVKVYSKQIVWEGSRKTISLFRCRIRSYTKRWFLAIVPEGEVPGTNMDIDFYSAPLNSMNPNVPPGSGWVIGDAGEPPFPTVTYLPKVRHGRDDGESQPDSLRQALLPQQTSRVRLDKAGLSCVNGTYFPTSINDDAPLFTKRGFWRGRQRKFSLFRCMVKGKVRRWYVSIVPSTSRPGTVRDVDFYTAEGDKDSQFPPTTGWEAIAEGRGRSPDVTVLVNQPSSEESESPSQGPSEENPAPAPPTTTTAAAAATSNQDEDSDWTSMETEQPKRPLTPGLSANVPDTTVGNFATRPLAVTSPMYAPPNPLARQSYKRDLERKGLDTIAETTTETSQRRIVPSGQSTRRSRRRSQRQVSDSSMASPSTKEISQTGSQVIKSPWQPIDLVLSKESRSRLKRAGISGIVPAPGRITLNGTEV